MSNRSVPPPGDSNPESFEVNLGRLWTFEAGTTPPRPVRVRWIDSQGGGGWRDIRDAPNWRPTEIVTVGFVIEDADDFLVLVQSLASPDADGDSQADGWLTIPRQAILDVGEVSE
jgi:hypothetical protein